MVITEVEGVLDEVQQAREDDALALSDIIVDSGAEHVPNETVLQGAVRPLLSDEAKFGKGEVLCAEEVGKAAAVREPEGPVALDHGVQEPFADGGVVLGGAVVGPPVG